MLPLHPSAKVDSLLALDLSPEHKEDYEVTNSNSTFFRYIQEDKDSPDIKILEIAGSERYHFLVFSFSRPKTDFKISPDGRVALSGEFITGNAKFNCTQCHICELVHMHKAHTEEQFYQGGSVVVYLEDTPEMKAWQVFMHGRFNYLVGRQVNLTEDADSL
ncbi:hypothetical protein THAR02_01836 [Trichoderma harzianum]|uniref:Uncharacterized protein n=1 Tax=Trichoderma harzianum TaxID=5544 RepID=A0A0F9XNF2_TRIHA|nr:hypothetical protein THAR02_01836 [Trichoderma harzianum]